MLAIRFVLSVVLIPGLARSDDWPMYLYDLAHSSMNPSESTINVQNAGQLTPAWTVSTGNVFAAGPTIVNGSMYIGDWSGNFYAFNTADGSMRWQNFVGNTGAPVVPWCQGSTGVSSQAIVNGNTVYVGGGDAALYAFDTGSGAQQWRVPVADPASGAYLWASLVPYGNRFYAAIASLDDCPLAQGAVIRVDLANPGKPLFRYLSPADDPGAGVWSTPALDTATNTLFVTTGTGDQDATAGNFGATFLSLDADTLAVKSYFFLPTWNPDVDIEWGSSPMLFALPDGTQLVAATGKDGVLYALNRADLSLAWTLRLAVPCVCPECGCGAISTPAFDGNLLYVGAGDTDLNGFDNGSVYAIDPVAQSVVWWHSIPGTVLAPVTIANGVLFVSTTAGALAYNAQTGDLLWNDDGTRMLYSQPVVVNGTLYLAYTNGDLTAWTLPSTSTSGLSRKPTMLE